MKNYVHISLTGKPPYHQEYSNSRITTRAGQPLKLTTKNSAIISEEDAAALLNAAPECFDVAAAGGDGANKEGVPGAINKGDSDNGDAKTDAPLIEAPTAEEPAEGKQPEAQKKRRKTAQKK